MWKSFVLAISNLSPLCSTMLSAVMFSQFLALEYVEDIENTSWKVLAYGIYARVVDVSEIERVSAVNE